MSLQVNPHQANQDLLMPKDKKAEVLPGFEDMLLVTPSDPDGLQQAKQNATIKDEMLVPDNTLSGHQNIDMDNQLLLMQLQQSDNAQAVAQVSQTHLAELPGAFIAQTLNIASVSVKAPQSDSQLMLPIAQLDQPQIMTVAQLLSELNGLKPEQVASITVTIQYSDNTLIEQSANGAMAAMSPENVIVNSPPASVELKLAELFAIEGQVKTQPAKGIDVIAALPEILDISAKVTPTASNVTGEMVTHQLVQWSSIATGKMSQQYSLNPVHQVNSMTTKSPGGERINVMPEMSSFRQTNGLENKATINQHTTNHAALHQLDNRNHQTVEQKHAMAAAKQHGALIQSLILPQKVTWSEQQQKLWVRDYFLSSQQTEQLLEQLKNGFADQSQVRTLVLNGKTLYQAGGTR